MTFLKLSPMKSTLIFILSLVIADSSMAQKKPLPAYAPTHDQMLARYKAATERDSLVRRTAYKLNVMANWSGPSAFWYRNALPDSQSEFLYVDPIKNVKQPLFDASKLAAALTALQGKTIQANRLPIRNAYLYPGGQKIAIAVNGNTFYDVDFCELLNIVSHANILWVFIFIAVSFSATL